MVICVFTVFVNTWDFLKLGVHTFQERGGNWVKLLLLFTGVILASARCQNWQPDLFSWQDFSEIHKAVNES